MEVQEELHNDFDLQLSEFNATYVRRIIQDMFPTRKLVLSQFTLYHQMGVSKPSGESFKRGRRCYRLFDLLPMALVLVLKEQGIPNKNIAHIPAIISERVEDIFKEGKGVIVNGYREVCSLVFPGEETSNLALLEMLSEDQNSMGVQDLYWSYDVGYLASELVRVAERIYREDSTLGTSDTTNQFTANRILKVA